MSSELAGALSGDERGSPAADSTEPGLETTGTRAADQPGSPRSPAEPLSRAEYADLMRGEHDRAAGGTDNPAAGRPDMAARYPGDYVAMPGPLPHVKQRHEDPQNWAADINADRNEPRRENNCGECARAVDSAWNGRPAVAGALARPEECERVSRMTEWAGVDRPVVTSMSGVGQRLGDMGPGSSAVVGCLWDGGGGHWFNAVNDGGTVKAVDGQSGQVRTWPPSLSGVGFDESMMTRSFAIFFTPDGKAVKE